MAYPTSNDTYRTVANMPGVVEDATKTRIVYASDVNKLSATLTAIMNFLGLKPGGWGSLSAGILQFLATYSAYVINGTYDIWPPVPATFPTTISLVWTAPTLSSLPTPRIYMQDLFFTLTHSGVPTTYVARFSRLKSFGASTTFIVQYFNYNAKTIVAAPVRAIGDTISTNDTIADFSVIYSALTPQ